MLRDLQLRNFRCFEAFAADFSPDFNFIVGPNGPVATSGAIVLPDPILLLALLTFVPLLFAVAWLDMVDFAVSPCGGALWSYTAILGASLGGRASKTPHMFALPRSPTLLRAPSSST